MSLPLEKMTVTVGTGREKHSVPAFDPRWMEQVHFVSYHAPPEDGDSGQFEAWLERMKFIEEDLHLLLQLPHFKFWSQVVFDESLQCCIDSYLRFAPRSVNVIQNLPEHAQERHRQVHRLVFMTCLRMSTYKESKECHITPSVFGEILYENFLFDILKLMDLCVLYGHGNQGLLAKMLECIFTQQPKYNQDLVHTVETFSKVFDKVMEKCGVQSVHSESPQKLSESASLQSPLVVMEMSEFKDIVQYLADIGLTLSSFLEVYPPACQAFHDSEFLVKLACFYELIIPELVTALKTRDIDKRSRQALKQQLIQAKKYMLMPFQQIVSYCCIQPILEKREPVSDFVEDFLHIMSSVLAERRFLADYDSFHSVGDSIEILSQAHSEIDDTRLQYIQDAVNSAFSAYGKRKPPKGAVNRGGRRSPDGSAGEMEPDKGIKGATESATLEHGIPSDAYQVEDYDLLGASMAKVTGVELESLVCSVKDLLPELGDGFIELCLEELGYDTERVINAVLEDRLPPSLQDVPRTMPRSSEVAAPSRSLVKERKNIYDFDEFDVFHRDDIDKRKVRKGKMDRTDTVILEKSVPEDIKESISRDYGVVEEVATAQDIYEDEYDDTYDTNVVGAGDADSADELTQIRPFTVPRVLGQKTNSPAQEVEMEDPQKDVDQEEKDRFIEDPAVIRQRAEDRAKWKASRAASNHTHKSHDVKGAPKGQGQSAEVLRNRRWKTQHKGEHRRAAADRKRQF